MFFFVSGLFTSIIGESSVSYFLAALGSGFFGLAMLNGIVLGVWQLITGKEQFASEQSDAPTPDKPNEQVESFARFLDNRKRLWITFPLCVSAGIAIAFGVVTASGDIATGDRIAMYFLLGMMSLPVVLGLFAFVIPGFSRLRIAATFLINSIGFLVVAAILLATLLAIGSELLDVMNLSNDGRSIFDE